MLLLQRITTIKIGELCKIYEKDFIQQDLINLLK